MVVTPPVPASSEQLTTPLASVVSLPPLENPVAQLRVETLSPPPDTITPPAKVDDAVVEVAVKYAVWRNE